MLGEQFVAMTIWSFCPVNSKDDPREKAIMNVELFEKIVNQLANAAIFLYFAARLD